MSGRIGKPSVLQTGVLHTLHPVQDRRGVILTSRIPAAFGQITVGDDDPEAIEPPENLQ